MKKNHIVIFEKSNWWYTLQTGLSLFVVILKLSFFFLFSIFHTESNTLSFNVIQNDKRIMNSCNDETIDF